MLSLDLEPVVYCLFASLAWAPIVYFAASRIDHDRRPAISELIWLCALGAAVLPTLLAPALAAVGVSLRPAPTETSLVISPRDLVIAAAAIAANPPAESPSFVSLDIVIRAIGLLYIYGVILAFVVWAARTAGFAMHVRRARPISYPQLHHALENWRMRLGVAAPLRIRKSDTVSSVCVYGIGRPVILIPADIDARVSFEDLVLMGAHELAHIKRGDCLFFAACSSARILFWFNPFVKRLAARAELAAERSADRLVLEAGADRRAYAACFVEGLRFAAERARETHVSVPSFTPFDRRSRRERLDSILSGVTADKTRPSKLFMAAALASAAVLAFAQAAVAVDPERRDSEEFPFSETPIEGEVTLAYGETVPGEAGKTRPAHEGIDIKAPKGSPVKAPADGIVVEATDVYKGKPSWGKVVVVRHKDGVVTRYAHLDSYSVKRGDRIKAGDVIAAVGASGAVTGPHLHFETHIDGKPADPTKSIRQTRPAKTTNWAAADIAPLAPTEPTPMIAADEGRKLAPSPTEPTRESDAARPVKASPPQIGAKVEVRGPDTIVTLKTADGEKKYVVKSDGGESRSYGYAMSDGDRKRLNESLEKMRRELKKAKREYKQGMTKLRETDTVSGFVQFDFDDFDVGQIDLGDLDLDDFDSDFDFEGFEFNPEDFADLELSLSDADKAKLERWREDHAWAVELAGRELKLAAKQAERERVRRDAEQARRDRERAFREAEEARRTAERAREEARLRSEEARRRGDEARRRAMADREASQRRHADALKQAERERERVRRDAERIRRDEQERVSRESEEARRTAEREREEARLRSDEARRRGDEARRRAMADREASQRRHADALKQAERDLAAERIRIEAMLADIAEKRQQKSIEGR